MQAAWMIAASLFFAGMGVCIKFASDSFDPLEVVFYRGVISVVFIGALARSRGISLRTHVPMMHVWRNVVGVASLVCWFYAIGQLPLSTAITLNYMSGIWIAAFIIGGTLAMGQLADVRRQGPLILTVMAGFAGVVLLLGILLGPPTLLAVAGTLPGHVPSWADVDAALAASVFHSGAIAIPDLKRALRAQGIEVRL